MILDIAHKTKYSYDSPVSYALQQIRLQPTDNPQQSVKHWEIEITGGTHQASYSDFHGNQTVLVSIEPDGQEISITAHGQVETLDKSGILGKTYGRAPLWFFCRDTPLTQPDAAILALAKPLVATAAKLDGLHALSAAIIEAVSYQPKTTYAETTAAQALEGGSGVCQDHAHIFLSAARAAKIPARYISGYLLIDGQTDQDASHAWVEAYLDDLGWVGFDVSNGISPDERYIRVATGLDYTQAAPISGLRMGSGQETMVVTLQVQQ